MELDDIKNAWAQHDKKLADKLRLDEEALRRINLEKTKDQMDYPYVSEKVELIGGMLMIVVLSILSFRLKEELIYLLLGFVAIAIGLLYMRFAIEKLRLLKKVSYFDTPLVRLQTELVQIKKRILTLRKTELLIFPLYLLPLAVMTSKTFYNVDLVGNFNQIAWKYGLALLLAYMLVFLIHKYLYNKRFQEVESIFSKLDEFEKEKDQN